MRKTGLPRRTLLVGGVGVAATLTGCDTTKRDRADPRPSVDPLRPVLEEALTLAAAYQRAALAQPGLAARLAPLAADHRAHADELARAIGTALPSAVEAGPGSSAATDVLAELRAAEQIAQRNAAAGCRRAPANRAALLGSIAACRATHAEALR